MIEIEKQVKDENIGDQNPTKDLPVKVILTILKKATRLYDVQVVAQRIEKKPSKTAETMDIRHDFWLYYLEWTCPAELTK